MPSSDSTAPVGYVELLRTNKSYLNLFVASLVSQTGDWFNSVALFTLLLNLTGSGEVVALVLILKLLPTFFIGPIAGVVVDRFNRKTIMIVSDVLRGFIVLGFLFVDRPERVWLVYVVIAAEVVISTFFEPAKTASIPNVVAPRELVSANALSGASWSVTLALGAALGGVVTNAFGRNTAFVIDSLSFFVSAAFVLFVRFPRSTARTGALNGKRSLGDITGVADFIEGARYLKSNLRVMALLLVKTGWGLGGGVLLLLAVFGKQLFPIGRDGSTSIGLLYAARGIGAMLGPMIAQRLTRGSQRMMRRTIGAAFFISSLFYLLFSGAPWLALAELFVIGAHAGGSIQWVFSTVLLQIAVPDSFRGRVFALEQALLTAAMSLSTFVTGWALDHGGISPRQAAALLGIGFIFPGTVWILLQRWLDRGEAAAPLQVSPEHGAAD
ncbi:MAG: MFS transporter [Blastocatellia bacterium AA13]|nr:MAG: MFS transporter [Blastocatellia bacterium AA13]